MKRELARLYNIILISSIIYTTKSDDSYDRNRPIISVQQGKLQGVKEKNINGRTYFYAFRGIPYAKPPVQELRFKVYYILIYQEVYVMR